MDIESKLEAAQNYLVGEQFKEAFDIFQCLNRSHPNNSQVLLNLGWLYQTGSGVDADIDKSIIIYQMAAEKGEVLADYYLATVFKSRNEIQKSIEHFKKSADSGHSSSAYWLGEIYRQGDGCDVDLRQAEHYLTLAKEAGHVFAKRDIALANIKGTFGKRKILSGLVGYLSSVLEGIKITYKNPNSHDMR